MNLIGEHSEVGRSKLDKKLDAQLSILEREVDKHYKFINQASPIDIFQPNKSQIKSQLDASKYFINSMEQYDELSDTVLIDKIYMWLEEYFKNNYESINRLFNLGVYHYEIEHAYAIQFSKLPYEYISESFILENGDYRLRYFFDCFDSYFDARGMTEIIFDWHAIESFDKYNI